MTPLHFELTDREAVETLSTFDLDRLLAQAPSEA